jgi:DNA-binding CsgD family transcriptional regulator
MHLHNEPDALADELPNTNSKHSIVVNIAASLPATAHRFFSKHMYTGPHQAQMHDYITRYGHDNHLIIADLASARACGEWISLYRSKTDDHFSAREAALLSTLMPHIVESWSISRQLARTAILGTEGRGLSGTRAFADRNGVLVACGHLFAQSIYQQWPDERPPRVPARIWDAVLRGDGRVRIDQRGACLAVRRCGDHVFMQVVQPGLVDMLTEREAAVATAFARGDSAKAIAKTEGRSPATIRNLLAKTFVKLGVHNKVELRQAIACADQAEIQS